MQAITKETVIKLANLSHIAVDDDACARLTHAMQELCDMTDALQADVAEPRQEDAIPLSFLRADLAKTEYSRADLLRAAPAHDGETFLVPRTVEE